MASVEMRLTDVGLFGNDAAEDESEEVFKSYVIDRPEVSAFADAARALAIARAYKGEGKSALLRITQLKLEVQLPPESVLVARPATELVPDLLGEDYSAWTRRGRQRYLDFSPTRSERASAQPGLMMQ